MNDFASAWFPTIWRATWQGGLFILAVWLFCRLVKGVPATVRYWLWWLASVQLLLRLAFFSPIALPLLPAPTETFLPDGAVVTGYEARLQPSPSLVATDVVPALNARPIEKEPVVLSTVAPSSTLNLPPAATFGFGLWLTGVLGWASFSLRRLGRTRRMIRRSRSMVGTPTDDLIRCLSAERGIRSPDLREVSGVSCPMLVGWFRPVILLPVGFADHGDTGVEMALVHELAHLRRHDLWFAIGPALAQLAFFFHPLAWLAANETAAAREESCDIEALTVSGGSPAAYARLLVDTAQANAALGALGAAFGYRLLQRRITMLNHSLRSTGGRYGRATSVFLIISAVCALPWTVTAQAKPGSSNTKPVATTTSKDKKKSSTSSTSAKKSTTIKSTKSDKWGATKGGKGISMSSDKTKTIVSASGATLWSYPAQAHGGVSTAKGTGANNAFAGKAAVGGLSTARGSGSNSAFAGKAAIGGLSTASGGGSNVVFSGTATVGGHSTAKGTGSSNAFGATHAVGGSKTTAFLGTSQYAGTAKSVESGTTNDLFGGQAGTAKAGGSGFGGALNGVSKAGGAGFGGNPEGVVKAGGGQSGVATSPGGAGFGGGAAVAAGGGTPGFGGAGTSGAAGGSGLREISASPNGKVFTLRFKNVDIHTALAEVFKAAGIDYVIKSNVEDDLVTCGLKDASVEDILSAILQGVKQNLSYRVERGVYIIFPR